MRKNLFTAFFLLTVACTACIKINLDRREIFTFNKTLVSFENLGDHQYIPLYIDRENSYWVGGIDDRNQSLISVYDQTGDLDQQFIINSPGEVSAICPINDTDSTFLLTTTTGEETYLVVINRFGQTLQIDSLRPKINMVIGLVAEVTVIRMIPASDRGWLLTGTIKQSLGGPRLLLVKLTPSLAVEWVRTYQSDLTGCGLLLTSDNQIAILSFNSARHLTLGLFDEAGVLQWSKSIPNASAATSPNLILKGDTLLTTASRVVFGTSDVLVVGYNLAGSRVFEKTYGLPAFQEAGSALAVMRGDGILIFSTDHSNQDYKIMRIEGYSGLITWGKTLSAESTTFQGFTCIQTSDFGIAALAFESLTNGTKAYRLIKTDEVGEIRR